MPAVWLTGCISLADKQAAAHERNRINSEKWDGRKAGYESLAGSAANTQRLAARTRQPSLFIRVCRCREQHVIWLVKAANSISDMYWLTCLMRRRRTLALQQQSGASWQNQRW